MTHICKQLDSTTARIVIECKQGYHTWRYLSIYRISFYSSGKPVVSQGSVLGYDEGKPSALILDVHQRDLVVIRAKESKDGNFICQYFRIGRDWVPRRLALNCPHYSHQQVVDLIELSDIVPDRQVDSSDRALLDFLMETHPPWLSDIFSRQIEHWHLNKLERFFCLAPSRATYDEIHVCINDYPAHALAHYKHLLTRRQIRSCVRRSLRGAVMHAFDELSPSLVEKAVVDHPHEMIRYAAHRLTDSQLERCAKLAPYAAFVCRTGMPPSRHAAMLAISYPHCAIIYYNNHPALRSEFLHSITMHPEKWLSFHNQSYSKLFRCLRNRLGLKLTASELRGIMKGTPEEYHQPLMDHIAGLI